MYTDEALLLYKSKETDSDGFDIDTVERYEVYVDVKSVKRAEFYAAMQAGMNPTISMSTRTEEYEQTKHIVNGRAQYAQYFVYDDAEYKILRSYDTGNGMIELTLGTE